MPTKHSFSFQNSVSQKNCEISKEKYVRMKDGWLTVSDSAKKVAWRYHDEKVVSVENAWEKELSDVDSTERSAIWIKSGLVNKAIKDMKTGGVGRI